MAILIFIIILVGLILVHEFGHFAVAKLFGIRVDEFGVGFPPKIWGKKFGETEYTINWLPFGGFVRIFGENKEEIAEGTEVVDQARAFTSKSKWTQAAVLVAGVAMNIIGGWALLSVGYMIGLPGDSTYTGLGSVQNTHVTILQTSPNSPAEKAGVIGGEQLIGIKAPSGSYLQQDALADDFRHFIAQHGSEELTLTLKRGEAVRDVVAKPEEGIVEGRPALGFILDDVGIVKLPIYFAVVEGAKLTYNLTISTAVGLWDFFRGVFTGKADFSSVSGPVGIVGIVDEASQFGITSLLMLAAVISVNLAIINLIPFPALDGGRLFMVALEGIARRPIPPKIFFSLNAAGFAILILLMLAVTYHDIAKLIVG